MLLMAKNIPVYDIENNVILHRELCPGAIISGNLTFESWMKTRYSARSNAYSRRMMLRQFNTDNHNNILKPTRALSLSDVYWLREKHEEIIFEQVTPYFNTVWEGGELFSEGSIATLFTNGAANKRWDNRDILRKFNSIKEYDVYQIAQLIFKDSEDARFLPKVMRDGDDLLIENFTSTNTFLESLEQSKYLTDTSNHFDIALDLYGKPFINLLLLDYLVEHDDRHSGNIGHLRDADSGKILGMAPFYDFDWCFSSYSLPLPDKVFKYYIGIINQFIKNTEHMLTKLPEDLHVYKDSLHRRIIEINKEVISRKSTTHHLTPLVFEVGASKKPVDQTQ